MKLVVWLRVRLYTQLLHAESDVHVQDIENNTDLLLCAVYVSGRADDKDVLWNELAELEGLGLFSTLLWDTLQGRVAAIDVCGLQNKNRWALQMLYGLKTVTEAATTKGG
ncbi:7384_t:CDS:2, partial [Paraglomus occultum]